MAAFRKLRTALGLRKPGRNKYVSVGRHSYGVGDGTISFAAPDARVTIGAFCSIAVGVLILAKGNHPIQAVSSFPFSEFLPGTEGYEPWAKGPILIGHDVWIGARAIILSGVTIGSGAVIGAGAVVSRDVPPYAIAVGNPARVVRYRFSPEIIERPLEIRWWDWPDEKIRAEMNLFYGSPEAFVQRHAPSQQT